ncbi:hypothetical protein GCM10025734_26190 [Kitasatospora paranensis]
MGRQRMSHFTELSQQYIDGQWRPGSGSWDIVDINPYSGEKLAAITVATVGEVDEAYRAAERAQRQWARINPYTRRLVFERALRVIEDREQEITATIIAELGGTRLKAGFELSSPRTCCASACSSRCAPRAASCRPPSTARRTGSTGCRSAWSA